MRILTVVGARPNFIKAYLISQELKRRGHEEVLVHTGQHYDYEMSAIFFKELDIPSPEYNLGLKAGEINLMTKGLEHIIEKTKPQLSLIYGDTNSSLAGVLASYLSAVPIAHIEAGERCFDFEMPEERNRILIDHYSDLLLCATKTATQHLRKEKVGGRVYFTGNVMFDSVLFCLPKLCSKALLHKLDLKEKKYLLLTLHRPQNVDSKNSLNLLLQALRKVKSPIIFPMHPRTRKKIEEFGLLSKFSKIMKIIPPQSYLNLLTLLNNAKLVMTDSGGVQAEAFSLKVPCLTFLNQTTWTETVSFGNNRVVGIDRIKIEAALNHFDRQGFKKAPLIFGKGYAHREIVDILERYLHAQS